LKWCFLNWIKVELENCILYTTVEEQREINSVVEKMALGCFGTPTGELFFVHTHSVSFASS
jgi:hypothetical protein